MWDGMKTSRPSCRERSRFWIWQVCTIKQHCWQRFQRPALERQAAARRAEFEGAGRPLTASVDFASFATHPLWQAEHQRANLSIKRAAGQHCARMLRASTPPRNERRKREWAAAVEAAERGFRQGHRRDFKNCK